MTIKEIIAKMEAHHAPFTAEKTCDGVIVGDADKECTGVVLTC